MMSVKHPGYLALSAGLIAAGGLLLATQVLPAAALLGAGGILGAKKGLSFAKNGAEKRVATPVRKMVSAAKTKKKTVKAKAKKKR